jgi:hypothetical protein
MSNTHLSKYQSFVLAGLFLAFVLVGFFVSDDYGVAWDEPSQIEIGQRNYDYLLGINDSLVNYHDRHYGAAYEMPIYALQKALNIENSAQLYNLRHLINHLVFIISLGFFFMLIMKLFRSFNTALLGTLMLYIHPRIFAHSFFNSKDIIFMSVFIIGLYSLLLLVEKTSRKRILFHAIISAILIDVRIIGIILPLLSILVFIPSIFKKGESQNALKALSLYSILLIIFIYAFWPALWTDPLLLGKSFLRMSQFPFHYDVLFQGKMIPAQQIPWNYIPTWFFISTPPFILLLSTMGIIGLIIQYFKKTERFFTIKQKWFVLVLASFPIDFTIILIIINSSLYDGWRQLYFLYPLALIAAVYAYSNIAKKLYNKRMAMRIINGFIIVFILLTVLKIYKLHPYEQVYFNHFVNKYDNTRRKSFNMDYWGLSFREALEYIVNNDASEEIKICFSNAAGPQNIYYLSIENQTRIIVVDNPEKADYFISNYRYHPADYEYKNEVFTIERDKNKVLSIFKIDR